MRYAVITDVTRPNPFVIMIHFNLVNGSTVESSGTHGFNVIRYDEQGNPVAETLVQKRARLRSEFDAYIDHLIDHADGIDAVFDTLRSQAIGYRFPAA